MSVTWSHKCTYIFNRTIHHVIYVMCCTLLWRHNGCDGVSNQKPTILTQPFIQAQIKENIKAPRHWPLWGGGIHRWLVNSPHIWLVTPKMSPFDDVIMMIHRKLHEDWGSELFMHGYSFSNHSRVAETAKMIFDWAHNQLVTTTLAVSKCLHDILTYKFMMINMTIFTPSLARFTYNWWRHNRMCYI